MKSKKLTILLSLLICLILFFFSACKTAGKEAENIGAVKKAKPVAKTDSEKAEAKKRFREAEAYIEKKRNDDSLYWGEGMANIGSDIGKAKSEARKQAIRALAGQIKIQVTSDFKRVTRVNGTSGETYSEAVERSIEEKLETYTSQVLTDLKESRLFIDYPQKGICSYMVYISKKAYEEKVRNDMDRKKQLVTETIRSGDRAFVGKRFVEGVKQYLQARQMKESFFGMIPLYQDIDGDGIQEELTIAIDDRVRSFFSGLRISLLNSGFQYDSQGSPETLPKIYVKFRNKSGIQSPVSGLPLKTGFVSGAGKIAPAATGDYGESEILVEKIDPKHRETVIRVSVDRDRFPGLKALVTGPEKDLAIKLRRKRTIALSLYFKNGKKKSVPANLKEAVAASVLENRYSVVHLPPMTVAGMKAKNDINADYVMLIEAKTSGGGAVGQYANMFTAYCGASVKIFKMPLKSLAGSESVRSAQGFGVSTDNAGWDGFGKIRGTIEKTAAKMIEGLK